MPMVIPSACSPSRKLPPAEECYTSPCTRLRTHSRFPTALRASVLPGSSQYPDSNPITKCSSSTMMREPGRFLGLAGFVIRNEAKNLLRVARLQADFSIAEFPRPVCPNQRGCRLVVYVTSPFHQ